MRVTENEAGKINMEETFRGPRSGASERGSDGSSDDRELDLRDMVTSNMTLVISGGSLPNLRMVDEVGMAMLIPGGGHGIAGSANLSNVELFAYPMPR